MSEMTRGSSYQFLTLRIAKVSENLNINFYVYKVDSPRKLNCTQSPWTFQILYETNSWNIHHKANGSCITFASTTKKSYYLFLFTSISDCLGWRQPNVHCRLPNCLSIDSSRLNLPWTEIMNFPLASLLLQSSCWQTRTFPLVSVGWRTNDILSHEHLGLHIWIYDIMWILIHATEVQLWNSLTCRHTCCTLSLHKQLSAISNRMPATAVVVALVTYISPTE